MPVSALVLVIVAAFIHAGWNLLVKRANGGTAFVWLYSVASTVLYAPIVIGLLVVEPPTHYGAMHWLLIVISGLLHLLYAVSLSRGYGVADLSVVYPLARGTGPLLTCSVAIVLLGERPTLPGYAGIALIIGGILLIAMSPGTLASNRDRRRKGVFYGVLTGLFIASYTINDAYAVRVLLVSPVLLDYFGNVVRMLFLTPTVIANRDAVCVQWRKNLPLACAVGALMPLSYIMALYAMRLAPVSYVAPARELSMLVGALLGAKLLNEGSVKQRLAGAALMVLGIAALVLS